MAGEDFLAPFRGQKYLSLETFRRDGTGVATPVWFAIVDDRVFCRSDPATAKVRRMRRNADVTAAPCSLRGSLRGERVAARAEFVPAGDAPRLQRAYDRKYRLEALLAKLPFGGPPGTGGADGQVFYELVPRLPVELDSSPRTR